jgi:hypothetical protein
VNGKENQVKKIKSDEDDDEGSSEGGSEEVMGVSDDSVPFEVDSEDEDEQPNDENDSVSCNCPDCARKEVDSEESEDPVEEEDSSSCHFSKCAPGDSCMENDNSVTIVAADAYIKIPQEANLVENLENNFQAFNSPKPITDLQVVAESAAQSIEKMVAPLFNMLQTLTKNIDEVKSGMLKTEEKNSARYALFERRLESLTRTGPNSEAVQTSPTPRPDIRGKVLKESNLHRVERVDVHEAIGTSSSAREVDLSMEDGFPEEGHEERLVEDPKVGPDVESEETRKDEEIEKGLHEPKLAGDDLNVQEDTFSAGMLLDQEPKDSKPVPVQEIEPHIELERKDSGIDEQKVINGDLFEVQTILAKQIMDGKVEYLVQWKGYSPADATWEAYQGASDPTWKDDLFKIKEFEELRNNTTATLETMKVEEPEKIEETPVEIQNEENSSALTPIPDNINLDDQIFTEFKSPVFEEPKEVSSSALTPIEEPLESDQDIEPCLSLNVAAIKPSIHLTGSLQSIVQDSCADMPQINTSAITPRAQSILKESASAPTSVGIGESVKFRRSSTSGTRAN